MRILRYVPRILNFWSSKEKNNREGKRKIFEEGKYLVSGGEENREMEKEKGKGGKYLEKEIIWSAGGQDDTCGPGGPDGPDGPSGQP